MKVIIFGATGSIGRELVKQSLEAGHEVTAFVRDPARLHASHSRLQIMQGDALNRASVETAVRGHDAVLCALGDGWRGTLRSEATPHIVGAMERSRVRRLICVSTLGAGDSWGNINFFWKTIMFGMFIRKAFEDHERQEEQIRKSGLDWTIVRPGAFTNGPRTGNYRHGFAPTDRSTQLRISRADVAEFILKQLTDSTYVRKTPGLSY